MVMRRSIDFGTGGSAIGYDNGFYGQDSWTSGRGVTIDAGVRVEKEYLPGEAQAGRPQQADQFRLEGQDCSPYRCRMGRLQERQN